MIGSVWKHKKTGRLYTVVGFCFLEAEWKEAVLYVRSDGVSTHPIAREKSEFMDGRFRQIKLNDI